MKVNLSCGDDEDYIIVYLGCYDYCDASGVCEKQVPVNPTSNTPYIPNSNIESDTPDEPTSNVVSNPTSNPVSNPTSNEKSNPTSNPVSNSTSNEKSNPTSNPVSNPTSNEDSNPTSNPNKCDMTIKSNMVLFFETSGGERIPSITFCTTEGCKEESITLPTPTREGYTFAGWYTDSSYETMVTISSNKSEDIKKLDIYNIVSVLDADGCGRTDSSFAFVYAKWVKEEEECPPVVGAGVNIIKFISNGGSNVADISICKTCGDATKVRTLPTPTREGYKFIGWYTDSTLTTKVKVNEYGLPTNVKWQQVGCYDSETTLYAKWEEEEITNYICEYIASTDGSWTDFGEWSSWSKEKVDVDSNTEVEAEVRKEVTGSKTEKVAVGTKYETYIKDYAETQQIVDYKTEKKLTGYETVEVPTGEYKYEKYVSGQTTIKEKTGYKTEEYVSGTKVEKYVVKTIKQKIKTGTKQVDTGKTVTKTTYVKVPAGTKNVYVKSGSGTTIPSNTDELTYIKTGSTTSQSCSGCVTKTIYTWDVYKKATVYKSEARTEEIPVYRTEDVYEEKEVPVYGTRTVEVKATRQIPVYTTKTVDVYSTRKVPVYTTKKVEKYETIKTPIYETIKTPIYGTREVTVYDEITVDTYSEVTYYRYRTRQYIDGAISIKWSTCDPVDENLIQNGFKLTGNKKEA